MFKEQKSTLSSHTWGDPPWSVSSTTAASSYFACTVSDSVQGRHAQVGSMPVIIYLWTSLARRRNRSECLCKDPRVHPPAMGPQGPLQSRLPRSDNGNQSPHLVPRTLSESHIMPGETEVDGSLKRVTRKHHHHLILVVYKHMPFEWYKIYKIYKQKCSKVSPILTRYTNKNTHQ